MSNNRHYLESRPIPAGFRIFDSRIEVAGIHFYKDDVKSLASASDPQIEFERDTANTNDSNAIKVIGCWPGFFGTKRRMIGFLPKRSLKPSRSQTYLGHFAQVENHAFGSGGRVEVYFQIIGPKDKYLLYRNGEGSKGNSGSQSVDASRNYSLPSDHDSLVVELLALVEEEERKAARTGYGVAPYPYERLAIAYRKAKRLNDEIAILERYQKQNKAPGASPAKLC